MIEDYTPERIYTADELIAAIRQEQKTWSNFLSTASGIVPEGDDSADDWAGILAYKVHQLTTAEAENKRLRDALRGTLAAMRSARDNWKGYEPDIQWVEAWDAARDALKETP